MRMADTRPYSTFRRSTLRLAWFLASCVFVAAFAQLLADRDHVLVLSIAGFWLFLSCAVSSILARRFSPFAMSLAGFGLLGIIAAIKSFIA